MSLTVLSVKVPRESENTPEQTAQLLASLAKATSAPGTLSKLFGQNPIHLSLEVTVVSGQVTFAIVYPSHLDTFVQSQVMATYPDSVMTPIKDYLTDWPLSNPNLSVVRQSYAAYFPLRDYADYKEVDPMLPLLGVLSKARETDNVLIQFVLQPAPKSTSTQAYNYLHPKPKFDELGKLVKENPPESKKIIEEKLSHPLVGVSIRFAVSRPELLHDLHGAISVLNRPDGNSLIPAKLYSWQRHKLWDLIQYRLPFRSYFIPLPVLNVMELSSLWHLPGVYTKIPNVAWAPSSVTQGGESPENLPVHQKPTPEIPNPPNDDIDFFAKTAYRNQEVIFGLKLDDRMRHVYVLGKSGTGKSTLLENMIIDDFKKGRGAAFIDPHGDSTENLLDYVPSHRINDVVYFNPADREYPISLNILEVTSPDQAELVASGIVGIFHKLYGHSWGPRLEYILRNTLMTLAFIPGSTLPDVIKMLTDYKFRQKAYAKLQDSHLLSFWQNEFDKLEEKTRLEHISPVLNKVGQFVNSPMIRDIISSPKSTIDLEDIMNSGKILLANLSQGKLGEDNSALLGAILVTKIELAAMNRVNLESEKRKEFFLYVDEFQNFATESFIKILSEARKFRLGLVLANQYINQVPEEIQFAIFGNAGTVICFVLGAEDAYHFEKEFGGTFTSTQLVSLQKHQIALRLLIDGMVSRPFLAQTLPPFKSVNQNRDKVISVSRQRWAKKVSPKKPVSTDQTSPV